jgi:hypothetical protein
LAAEAAVTGLGAGAVPVVFASVVVALAGVDGHGRPPLRLLHTSGMTRWVWQSQSQGALQMGRVLVPPWVQHFQQSVIGFSRRAVRAR